MTAVDSSSTMASVNNNSDVNEIVDVPNNPEVNVSTAQVITSNQPAMSVSATTFLPTTNLDDDSVFDSVEGNQES